MTRTPLAQLLRRAFGLAAHSQQPHTPPADELIGLQAEARLARLASRRQFLRQGGTLAAGIGALALAPGLVRAASWATKGPAVAIVGAGIAGLSAARELGNAGYRPPVFEASGRVGGRILTAHNLFGADLHTELGGEFIDSIHANMLDLADEFGLELLDAHADAATLAEENTFFFEGKRLTMAHLVEGIKPYVSRIQADYATIPDQIGYQNPKPCPLDNLSIDEYLAKIGLTGWVARFIQVAYTGEMGLDAAQQSALNLLYYLGPIKLKGNSYELFGESDERYKVKGGMDQITKGLADQLLPDQLRLDHVLTAVRLTPNSRYELVFAGGLPSFQADIVILALPVSTLRLVDLSALALPDAQRKFIAELGMGTNSKLMMAYNSRPWREAGCTGYLFTDKIHNGWDNTQMQGGNKGPGGYTVFMGGKAGADLAVEQANAMRAELAKVWPDAANASMPKAQVQNWSKQPHALGSYACYMPGQYNTLYGAGGLPHKNHLFFCGEHLSDEFQGYMEGGAETGIQAAKAALKAIKAWK